MLGNEWMNKCVRLFYLRVNLGSVSSLSTNTMTPILAVVRFTMVLFVTKSSFSIIVRLCHSLKEKFTSWCLRERVSVSACLVHDLIPLRSDRKGHGGCLPCVIFTVSACLSWRKIWVQHLDAHPRLSAERNLQWPAKSPFMLIQQVSRISFLQISNILFLF